MLQVARVDRPHGLRGELVVTAISDDPGRLEPGSVLSTEDGSRVEVVASRPHQHRHLVRLAGLADRAAAEAWRGRILYGEGRDGTDGTLWVHRVVGAEVVTTDGEARGTVVSVVANAASDLLELDGGALVPAAFVTDTSGLPERVVVDPPDGLFDL